jgi:precorrin-6A/cobalt-precorrin-6A reductase
MSETIMRVLILGGTTEAAALARLLAGDARFAATLSLAGRTADPSLPDISYRIGGFGGSDGLARWMRDERIAAVVDATHPFADSISANAVNAARAVGVPLASVVRARWERQANDRWIEVDDVEGAVKALGDEPRRVFLTIGRSEVPAFKAAPMHHYVVRSVEAPAADDLPANAELILQRGPFETRAEEELLRARGIDVIVAKNSGGAATYGKIAAARACKLPVIMIARPVKPAGLPLPNPQAAHAWLVALLPAHDDAASERGV